MASSHRKFSTASIKRRAPVTAAVFLLLVILATWLPLNVLVYRNDDFTKRALLDINTSLWIAEPDRTAAREPDLTTRSTKRSGVESDMVVIKVPDNNTTVGLDPDTTSAEAEEMTVERQGRDENLLDTISLPGIHNYLPHLKNNLQYLVPAVKISQNRTGVELVFGIPTIKRPEEDYLVETLDSLLSSISPHDSRQCLVVVLIAEANDDSYVKNLAAFLEKEYAVHVESGLLEIIAPRPEFYPDFKDLPPTLNDSKERVRWRSKQNLDYAYLMLYAHTRGNYYIQLEDDVLTQDGIFRFIMKALLWQRKGWFSLNFSPLGFIGKLFRTADVPLIAEFLLMFYTDKPGDWLLDNLMSTKVCGQNMTAQQCTATISRVARIIRPSQFQHVGYHSSLKGKVQLLRDKSFRIDARRRSSAVKKMKANFNPTPTAIETTISQVQKNKIEFAYMGQGIFWGMTPTKDDVIDFIYEPPIKITRYALVSGSQTNSQDVFPEDTTVEVLIANSSNNIQEPGIECRKDFQVVGHFDKHGVAKASLPTSMDRVGVFRIHVNSNMTTWVILSNISIMQA
ncbi:hypothetical protein BsWGS_17836 [Bradybaena similaris]